MLLAWYGEKKRDLPWRQTRDPYAIWVSEVMLQQTQVATVLPYYERWMQRFPTVHHLAEADEQEVLRYWQGLGYYRRVKNLLKGARQVALCGVPGSTSEWLLVPGVGRYTAGAIASIALGEAAPVVDGNVQRVYARLMADRSEPWQLSAKAWEWAAQNLDHESPGDWNQALMELGARICTPVAPKCRECPLKNKCTARQFGLVDQLPVRPPRVETVKLKFHVWAPYIDGHFGFVQVPAGEWWSGMWEFPRSSEEAVLEEQFRPAWTETLGVVKHSVTHHRLSIHASLLRCGSQRPELRWVPLGKLAEVPLPSPQRKVLRLALRELGLEPK